MLHAVIKRPAGPGPDQPVAIGTPRQPESALKITPGYEGGGRRECVRCGVRYRRKGMDIMSKRFALLLVLVLVLAVALPAGAITWGQPDGDDHPYVGTLLFEQTDGYYSCSATLLSETIMITAGHCTASGGVTNLATWVTFDEVVDVAAIINRDRVLYPTINDFMNDPANGWITATAIPHPDYADFAGFPNTRDVGALVLDSAAPVTEYAELPELGEFDQFDTSKGKAADRRFTIVGYGTQGLIPPFYQDDWARYQGETTLTNTRSAYTRGYNFQFTNSPGNGNGSGGTCFGDSGGPAFYQDTKTIGAITSYGITPLCNGLDFSYRADIAETLDFMADVFANYGSWPHRRRTTRGRLCGGGPGASTGATADRGVWWSQNGAPAGLEERSHGREVPHRSRRRVRTRRAVHGQRLPVPRRPHPAPGWELRRPLTSRRGDEGTSEGPPPVGRPFTLPRTQRRRPAGRLLAVRLEDDPATSPNRRSRRDRRRSWCRRAR